MVNSVKQVKPLFIRADAGGFTGTGHVMRMMALAQGYVRRGGQVTIASVQCPGNLVARLKENGIKHHFIDATQPGSKEDAKCTLQLAEQLNCEWLVLDGYHFDYAYQKQIKQSELSLLCTDDHGYSDKWCCDAILNQNLDAEKHFNYKNDVASYKRLLGSSFCLFREEFLQQQEAPKEWGTIQRLLITLGGSDPENATAATLRLLNQSCARVLEIRVLAGADNRHLESLRNFESQHSIEVIQNANNMPEQYEWADGIISAGGSTCWEWLYRGLPGAIVTIADNQLPIVKALTEERRAALGLGWFNQKGFEACNAELARWLEHPGDVCDAQIAHGIIDGGGVQRVSGALMNVRVQVREARPSDSDQYLVWANDPGVRENSFTPDPIEKTSHVEWFSNRIVDSDTCLLVVYNEEEQDVGQVRFEYDQVEQGWVIDFSIDSRFRGDGYGKAAMRESLYWLRQKHGSPQIVLAEILDINPASKRVFEVIGFKKIGKSDQFASYSLAI